MLHWQTLLSKSRLRFLLRTCASTHVFHSLNPSAVLQPVGLRRGDSADHSLPKPMLQQWMTVGNTASRFRPYRVGALHAKRPQEGSSSPTASSVSVAAQA